MHDSENGPLSATAAETLVLTSNLVYSEPSNYFDVININHHHHHRHHHDHDHHHLSHIRQDEYHENQYNYETPSNVDQSNNNNELSLPSNQDSSRENVQSMIQRPLTQPLEPTQLIPDQHLDPEQPQSLPYTLINHQIEESALAQSRPLSVELSEATVPSVVEIRGSSDLDVIIADQQTPYPPPEAKIPNSEVEPSNEKLSSDTCNIGSISESKIDATVPSSHLISPTLDRETQLCSPIDELSTKIEVDCTEKLCESEAEQDGNAEVVYDEDEDDDEEEEEEEDDEEADDDDDCEEDNDEDEDEDLEDNVESEDDSEDLVDPGQHCQLVQQASDIANENLIDRDESRGSISDILDGERMLEVTRKLVRNTERDPDRDLRKQVLLKTAIKKLPHFMEYNRYSDSLDRSFHNMSPQAYYEHHDSQPSFYEHPDPQQKFYHTVQPNAIQMSTTSLQMLDLNDDPELGNIEEHPDANLTNRTIESSLDQHDYATQNQYDRYSYETASPMINRHNALDLNDDMKDSDERIPIAFQISCEIYESSLNTSNDFYHNSHDSGVALFSPRSNKRSSSGLDDDMDLSNRSPSIGSNNEYKKLRKREIMD